MTKPDSVSPASNTEHSKKLNLTELKKMRSELASVPPEVQADFELAIEEAHSLFYQKFGALIPKQEQFSVGDLKQRFLLTTKEGYAKFLKLY